MRSERGLSSRPCNPRLGKVYTPARTHFISGLPSLVLKLTLMLKSGLEFFILKCSKMLLPSAKKSKKSRPLLTLFLSQKKGNLKTGYFSPLIGRVLAGVNKLS